MTIHKKGNEVKGQMFSTVQSLQRVLFTPDHRARYSQWSCSAAYILYWHSPQGEGISFKRTTTVWGSAGSNKNKKKNFSLLHPSTKNSNQALSLARKYSADFFFLSFPFISVFPSFHTSWFCSARTINKGLSCNMHWSHDEHPHQSC